MESARLRRLLTGADDHVTDDSQMRLRRAATLLELSTQERQPNQEIGEVWEIIALIHEALGVVDASKQDYEWLLSALAWQLAEAVSVGSLLASKLIERETFEVRDAVEKIALALSLRNFAHLQAAADTALLAGKEIQKQAEDSKSWEDALEAGMLLSIGTVMYDLARYVRFEIAGLPDRTGLEDFLNLALATGNSRRFRVGRLLFECVHRFSEASSRMVIEQLPTLTDASKRQIHEYLRQYPELWPSQRDAIAKGLLDPARHYFVVSVPTSSGKTLCGELVMLQQLSEDSNAVCFYVVPTRALVTEKSRELEHNFREFHFSIAAATGALQRDETESSLLADARIIVCTPEKLDLLIRHEDESLANASLFIIDETQMIADDDRGLGLEFVVVKLLLLKPEARILLLSAMLPNSEEFGRWLSRQAQVSSSDWRPTRQRFGEIQFNKSAPTGVHLDVVLYDTSGDYEGVRIPIAECSRQPKSNWEKVVWSIEAFREKGPVLVFCMTKPRCEVIVDKIVTHLKEKGIEPSVSPGVENLRKKIKREVASHFLLDEALALGVAYHHADLPPRIRVDLEELIAKGEVRVVVSTTTLAEGVNLPISTVIFEDWMTPRNPFTQRSSEPLDLSKFRNIAGRAGRAGRETEGLILFLDPGRKPVKLPRGKTMTPREYFVRADYPPIRSRFLGIVTEHPVPDDSVLDQISEKGDRERAPELRRALRQFGSAVLHAIEILKPNDDDVIIERLIEHSLLAVQAPGEKERAKAWLSAWARFYRRVKVEREELRPIAMQVGLPLRSVQKLYARASAKPDLIGLFAAENANEAVLTEEQVGVATAMVAEIEELDWEPQSAPHSELLRAWLTGASITELSRIYAPHLPKGKRSIEQTCNYVTQQLSNAGAWGMYALARVLELILGEDKRAPIVKRLPLLSYFGVNTTPAALLSLIGIERVDALRLGEAFLAVGNREISVVALKTWAKDTGRDRLVSILHGSDGREVDNETLRILQIA